MNYSRSRVVLLVSMIVSTLGSGCGLELDYGPPGDAMGDAARDAASQGTDGSMLDAGGSDAAVGDGGTIDAATIDAGSIEASVTDAIVRDASVADAADGAISCEVDADCDAAFGSPPCGLWMCSAHVCSVVCADCTDEDGDGYGVGGACAGPDCDDTDPMVTDTGFRGCSVGGAPMGACHGGTETCSAGAWGACLGAQGPTVESCNGRDDDCNGVIDDGLGTVTCGVGMCSATVPFCASGSVSTCSPATTIAVVDGCGAGDEDCDGRIDENCTNCVWVSTTGSDSSPAPRLVATPLATVQAAINLAAMDPTFATRVCLLSNGCSSGNAIFNGPVHMANGVHVQGNYALAGATLCATGVHTEIRTGDATGVLFDASIARHTELADVMVTPASTSTSAGITVDGALGAVISGVVVGPGPTVQNGYGVDIRGGGDATVQRSVIYAGRGSNEAIGVRVVGARAAILGNCPGALDGLGRCTVGCSSSGQAGIRGATSGTATTSYAILLRDAAGSIVGSSATCGQVAADGAGIRISGESDGIVVRGNFVAGFGPVNASYGIDIASCGGASPVIADNAEINAEAPASSPAVAIRSLGDCHPVVQNNLRIISGIEGSMSSTGIVCGADTSGVSSRCVIEGNPMIRASVTGFPMTATGIDCASDACARIERNDISAVQGGTIAGLRLGTAMAFVARNRIVGGCAVQGATGVVAVNSRARLQNNVVLGGAACAGTSAFAMRYVGLSASATDATYAIDVHGNDFDPAALVTAGTACTSRGVELTGHPGVDVAALRGNILVGGACAVAYPLYEVDANSDPLALEYNDLVALAGRPVYRDEGTTDVTTAALVDALADTVLVGDLDVAPGFVSASDRHLAAGSMCIDRDHSVGAPLDDFDGRTRMSFPDIGAFEH